MIDLAHFRDKLVTLREGDEAVHLGTGEVVRRYCGYIYYLMPTGGGSRESKLQCDIHREVEGVIGGNQLPGIWALRHESPVHHPPEWNYSD